MALKCYIATIFKVMVTPIRSRSLKSSPMVIPGFAVSLIISVNLKVHFLHCNILQKEAFIIRINYYKIRHLYLFYTMEQISLPVEYFRDVNMMDSASLLDEKLVFLRDPH